MNLNMLHATSPVNSLSFQLHGMLQGSYSHPLIVPQQELTTYTLIVVQQGEGVLTWNNEEHSLMYGTCFLLNPHCTIEIKNTDQSPLSLWILTFSIHTNESHPPSLLNAGEFSVPSFEALIRELKEIAKHQHTADAQEKMAAHNSFQKLMGSLLQHLGPHKKTENSRQAVLEIIAKLKENYQQDVSVEELARQAKISIRRFTHWFKLLTGTNVSGFMTALRINQAKQLLLSGGRLQEIADTVGYRDEFYFNRRFKQTVGISPGQFIRNHKKQQVNICAMSCLGHLLALGIRPIAAAKNLANNLHLRELSSDIHKVNSIPMQLEEIANLQPELILAPCQNDYDKLSTIAPTLLLSGNEHNPLSLLQMLGETFNKQQEAEQWIVQYNRKTERHKARLADIFASDETFSSIEIRSDSIYVFGNFWCRGAYNLYDGLELAAPAIIQREMINKEAYRIISEEQLPLYVGDHLFLTIVDPDRFKQLSATLWWKSLPAVKNNHVYHTQLEKFRVSDPISLHKQLDTQMKLLLAR
ncbi:helix-turn-helix domain-containing protein [Paenibacillus sp. FSL H8-0537]|uniref:helix-turn-helix domain-containing protein n=1 Tax=Paenibacillus sp. FSL H8-0537 TaxID=2921399 RepID=UPI003101202A